MLTFALRHRTGAAATASVVLLASTGLVVSAAVAGAQAASGQLTAVVALSPSASTVGQRVVARVNHSTKPTGDRLSRITVNWGDNSKTVALSGLTSRASHRYQHPGRYAVRLRIVDAKNNVATDTAFERVTAPAGSYTGFGQFGQSFGLYVSANGTSIQDVANRSVSLTCTPGGAVLAGRLVMASIPVKTDGAFAATTKEHGVVASPAGGNFPATFTYTFKGRLTGLNSLGAMEARGSWRETVKFTDSAARTCTTGTQPYTVTRDSQPAQKQAAPQSGSYAGLNQNGNQFSLYVSAHRTALQDIAIVTSVRCSPGTVALGDRLTMANIPIKPNGSFTGSTTENGVFQGQPATFSYEFDGHFHAVNSTGVQRAAGTWRETVRYTDTAARVCTTNAVPFTVTRDSQPAQTDTKPPAGTYTGLAQFGQQFTYTVSADQAHVENVHIPTFLNCSPGNTNVGGTITISSATIKADRSFSVTTTQSDVFQGHPAQFTFTFRGNFHAVNSSGAARAAGTYLEKVTYNDGVAHVCSSDAQPWVTARTA